MVIYHLTYTFLTVFLQLIRLSGICSHGDLILTPLSLLLSRLLVEDNGVVSGLYLSVGIIPKLEATDGYQLTLASAWGIAAQLRQCGLGVGIKWPNDLVLHGRKLGGILTETKVLHGQITQAVIGVGINWANPVPDTGINLQSWQASQPHRAISCLETLTATVLLGIKSGMNCLCQEGVSVLLSRYLELLTNIGDQVYINNLLGTVVGVTSQGKLHVSFASDETNEIKIPEIYLEPGTISLGYRESSV